MWLDMADVSARVRASYLGSLLHSSLDHGDLWEEKNGGTDVQCNWQRSSCQSHTHAKRVDAQCSAALSGSFECAHVSEWPNALRRSWREG